jgi:REP element-mobilizing transposase RayT
MNRGRARQKIFHNQDYYEMFLSVLAEAHQRFGVEIHSYCLMTNHYHLLVKTPDANLGRVMRHINGVYTQRHNRMKKTDGSLFRGRYKAICVEEDSYQLQLSRYIHRNPLEAKMVTNLETYPWSSYGFYVGKSKRPPKWLYQDEIFGQLGARSKRREKYKAYVGVDTDEELTQFYGKGNVSPYLGSDEFRAWAYAQRITDDDAVSVASRAQFKPSIASIVTEVAIMFTVTEESILKAKRGTNNVPRWVAMYLCQVVGDQPLTSIAEEFSLKRTGSIPTTISKLKVLMDNDRKLLKKVNSLMVER